MKTLLQLFDEILNNNYKETPVNNTYELTEVNVVNYPITKVKKKGTALVYKFDQSKDLFPFFDIGKPFINKSSDYVIFNKQNEKTFAFIIELKSKRPKDAYKQLLASDKFVKYLNSMAVAYSKIVGEVLNDSEELEIRHIIIALKSPAFATNVRRKSPYHLHKDYGYLYLHWKAGTDFKLDDFCR